MYKAEVSLKTWVAQGTGHNILYSGACDASDEELVADLLGDVTSPREDLVVTNYDFANESVSTVLALSSYALERADYDASYAANKSEEVFFHAENRIGNITQTFVDAMNASFEEIENSADLLVSCVSPRGDGNLTACPIPSVREVLDAARAELDSQLAIARAGFDEYAEVFAEYKVSAVAVHDNALMLYEGVTNFFMANDVDTHDLGEWAELSLGDFALPSLSVPSADGILSDYSDVPIAEDIWENVSSAYSQFSESVAGVAHEVLALAEAWETTAMKRLENLSITFDLEDYDPPQFQNASSHDASNALLELTRLSFGEAADSFATSFISLLDALGPLAANRSFPPSATFPNYTFNLDGTSVAFTSSIEYNFAAFTSDSPDFSMWIISLSSLGFLLIAADYLFRSLSSVRLLIQFWDRGGLNMPDADLRVDKRFAGASGWLGDARTAALRILLHPSTTVIFFSTISALMVYNLAVMYIPLFEDYRAGCVEHTKYGSFFSQNIYSIVYNYAADSGNRDVWAYQVRAI